MTRFWLIRHGEPAAEIRRRCYGSLDVGLSETGRTQMAEAAECLKEEPLSVIYTSPRSRAIEGARILAAGHSCLVDVMPDLREIDFGDFEGLAYDEIAARHPHLYRQWMEAPTEVKFPNGESFSEMRARVLRAFESIQREREERTVAIVSHGGVNRIILAWALQMPAGCLFRLAQDYGAINLLTLENGLPSVQLVNRR